MSSKNEAVQKLLPKNETPQPGKEDEATLPGRRLMLINVAIALTASLLLAWLLLPRTPLLEKGDIAAKNVFSPYTLYVEYTGPDQAPVAVKVNKGDLIVEAGHPVTERTAKVLEEIARRDGVGSGLHAFGGLTALVLVFLYLFYRDIKRYRPTLIRDTRKILLLAVLLLLTVLLAQSAKFVFSLVANKLGFDTATVGFALPVAAGAMLTSLLLDFHLALGLSFVVSILLGISFQGDPFIPVFYFLTSIVAALRVVRCKKRSALLKAGAWTVVVSTVVLFGIDLYHGELMTRGLADVTAGFIGAVLTTMIVSVTLPFFETIFDISTDIKLLELLDPNHPLLKELVYKSPGTYHHSIVIGNLAEAAAETIGENPILARVGAYYHDIGKVHKPEYFIENQRPTENKHDRLMPSMSSLIISSHVKDGVDLARSQRLPSTVVDIIGQHHGTSLISFFYQKARELHPYNAIAEADYRYPGPRPRTKVAAIVMLADSVEAASRTLDDPTHEQIQAMTSSVITRIFLDDQLSACDLTLKDLREISKSFNFVLSGIFHHRIDYPGMEFPGEKKRGEHHDKKQTEGKKARPEGPQEPHRDPLADVRSS